jgi:hypothetical protein
MLSAHAYRSLTIKSELLHLMRHRIFISVPAQAVLLPWLQPQSA